MDLLDFLTLIDRGVPEDNLPEDVPNTAATAFRIAALDTVPFLDLDVFNMISLAGMPLIYKKAKQEIKKYCLARCDKTID